MFKRIMLTAALVTSLTLVAAAPAQATFTPPPPVAICVHGVGGHLGTYVNGTHLVRPVVANLLLHFFPRYVSAGACEVVGNPVGVRPVLASSSRKAL